MRHRPARLIEEGAEGHVKMRVAGTRWEMGGGQKAEEGLREKLSCRREMSGWTGRRPGSMLLLGDHPGWLPGASTVFCVCAVSLVDVARS